MKKLLFVLVLMAPKLALGQDNWGGKFEQLGSKLPGANEYRTASGAPGSKYWQQRADYTIEAELNDDGQRISGRETITYYNQSPDDLAYLWLQLDQNIRSDKSDTKLVSSSSMSRSMSGKRLVTLTGDPDYSGGFNIHSIQDAKGNPLPYFINKTMMRIDLPYPLHSGEAYSFEVGWSFKINDRMVEDGRSGYEYFPEDNNYIYTVAQWFPRMAVYNDLEGWQNKQFLGDGEFALTFGNYEVKLTVPDDHMVAATGELQNPTEVLSETELKRLNRAKESFDKPVIIRTEKEARAIEQSKTEGKSTWFFKAENVRDFAFASSRKFIWDAMAVQHGSSTSIAMSYYPKEGNPLWEKESTLAVANTLKTYSRFTIDYPYPVAISVHTASIGMEYPMICFNYGRPDRNGNYSKNTRQNMIDVIIHEVGHNFFPMIINSDERQWAWMDEGLDTFLENQTIFEHYPDFHVSWGTPKGIVPYMRGSKESMRPIMTNPEQVLQLGYNAYSKPSAALHILRETVMGPKLFDHAFKSYAQRWAFKHPSPADFFRSMEDASAVDLDWFWKGWFYSTDHVDLAVDKVKWYRMEQDNQKPESKFNSASSVNMQGDHGNAKNFSVHAEVFEFKKTQSPEYREFKNKLDDLAIKYSNADKNFYEVTFKNNGGLVMPIIIEWTYIDGSQEIEKLPAEIWRKNEEIVTKVFAKNKEVTNIIIDPKGETADVDTSDNTFPRVEGFSKFDRYKKSRLY
ncbi:MAG: M1 family metallopeptidase [Cyclobacteriaceae bacterium]